MDRLETSKLLKNMLESLLGEDGGNVLGKYELWTQTKMIGEVASIYIDYPQITYPYVRKIVEESGIECIINPNPNSLIEKMNIRSISSLRFWEVTLDQHNPTGLLIDAVELIYATPSLRPMEQPIFREAMELPNNQGFVPPRAIIYIPQKLYVPGLF